MSNIREEEIQSLKLIKLCEKVIQEDSHFPEHCSRKMKELRPVFSCTYSCTDGKIFALANNSRYLRNIESGNHVAS
jgi:hypothetical protein